MRFDKSFCARIAVRGALVAAAVSVFGLSPVHAQTAPSTPPQTAPRTVRMSIDDAVATALEQNLDLQVQRLNPQLRRAAATPTTSASRSRRRGRAALTKSSSTTAARRPTTFSPASIRS
jgi:hypothetical protein